MNNFTIMGNLTRDPELTEVGNDKIKKCRFTIAVKRPNTKDTTDFIPCTAWRANAENISKYFSKGRKILVSGYVTSNTYQDKDGQNKTSYDWNVSDWEFCDKGMAVPTDLDTGTYVDEPEEKPTTVTTTKKVATTTTTTDTTDMGLPF